MKKFFLQQLAMAITALGLYTYTPAQTGLATGPYRIADAGVHSTLMAELKAKSLKSFNHFTKSYPDAILEKIREERDGTHIKATINGNRLKVQYDVKGKFQNAVLTYPSSELNEKTADDVMQYFPGYTVFGMVIDVTVRNESALLVMIENRKGWKRVRITNDGIDVYEEYVKSPRQN